MRQFKEEHQEEIKLNHNEHKIQKIQRGCLRLLKLGKRLKRKLSPAPTQEGAKTRNRSSVAKGKGKASKEEVFCLCRKPSEIEDGPMIECAECNDW
jgi:hypothetical protein